MKISNMSSAAPQSNDVGFEYEEPQSLYSVASQSLVNATIDLLLDYRCFETPQGWILALHHVSLHTFLWRPEDGERIPLPSMEKNLPRSCKCLLSDKPGSSGFCAVMVLDLHDYDYWICPVGGSKWECYGYSLTLYDANDKPSHYHMARRHGIAAVGGKVYYDLEHDFAIPYFCTNNY